jgi:hypothetical protein
MGLPGPCQVKSEPLEQGDNLAAYSFGVSATSQQYFFLRTNQPPAISQQYFSLRTNQHQPSATSQTNRPLITRGTNHHKVIIYIWVVKLNESD